MYVYSIGQKIFHHTSGVVRSRHLMALILKVLNALEPVVVSSLHAKIGVQLAFKQLRKVQVAGGGIQSNTDIAHN